MQCQFDKLVPKCPGYEFSVGGVALAVVLLSGENTPKLSSDDAETLVLGIFHEGEDVGGEDFDVGGGHVDEVVPDELEKGLQAELKADAFGDGFDELGYQILPALADLHD